MLSAIGSTTSPSMAKTATRRAPAKYEEPAEEDRGEVGEEAEEGRENEEGQEGGNHEPQVDGAEPVSDSPPEGYDYFVRCLEHALKTHPDMFGMVSKYAEDMESQAAEQPEAGMPVDDAGAAGQGEPTEPGSGDINLDDLTPEERAILEKLLQEEAEKEAMAGGVDQMPAPSDSAQEMPIQSQAGVKRYETDRSTIGTLGGAVAGGAAGVLGGPLAPITVPLGAVAGGKLGGDVLGSEKKPEFPGVAAPAAPKKEGSTIGRVAKIGGGAALGSALGGPLGGLGGAALGSQLQNDQVPVAYQAAIKSLESKFAKQTQAQQQRIAELESRNALQDAQSLVYQLQRRGVVKLFDEKWRDECVMYLAQMPEEQRRSKALEIDSCWVKDEALAYEMAGAPVGDFVQVSDRGKNDQREAFTSDHMELALKRLRSEPREHKGMSREEKWEECMAYAMSGGVVTYQGSQGG